MAGRGRFGCAASGELAEFRIHRDGLIELPRPLIGFRQSCGGRWVLRVKLNCCLPNFSSLIVAAGKTKNSCPGLPPEGSEGAPIAGAARVRDGSRKPFKTHVGARTRP